MVVEDFTPFLDWLKLNLWVFGTILISASLLGILVGYLVSVLKHGPFEAFYVVAQVISQAIPDVIHTSPRRVWAIARLAIKEAMHRKVILVAFAIFASALLFGGWFVDSSSENPERIYINFVMWGTQLLILLMGILLAAFSIPEDIKNRTVYTVVTKPVRATEIVLGRIVGFGVLGTLLLVVMGLLSYLFVYRGLSHTHQIVGDTQTLGSFVEVDQDTMISRIDGKRVSEGAIKEAITSSDTGHKHRIELIEDIRRADDPPPRDSSSILSTTALSGNRIAYQRFICSPLGEHRHRVTVEGSGDDAVVRLWPASGYFRARVPFYAARLTFTDRDGTPTKEGINVGREWGYRGYVDGGSSIVNASLSEARFDFENFTTDRFQAMDILPLEMTLSVFRTYKADIEKRVTAGLQFESIPDEDNPLADRYVSELFDFESAEYSLQVLPIPRQIAGKLVSSDGKTLATGSYDLFEHYARNGKLRLRLSCRDLSQYIGVARADIYFRAADEYYPLNFAKGYFGIWCQMMIIISLGVALSTFLNSPVTMLGTLVAIIVGFFTGFIREMMDPEAAGGGPIESFIRVVSQENMVSELETGLFTTLMKNIDLFLVQLMVGLTYLAPNFTILNFSEYLTYGYAIDTQRILVALTITLIFCIGLTMVGYFALKTREIAK
jgi:hypothetical protein